MSGYKRAHLGDGKWVSTGGRCQTPLFRGVFYLPEIEEASITLAVFGFFALYLNGKRVGQDLFLSLASEYQERTDLIYGGNPFGEEFRFRLYCPVYDVTPYLTEGKNTICIMMGPGWYERPGEGYGRIKLCYHVSYRDKAGIQGSLVSDESLKWKPGFIKEANLWLGETHDYRGYEEAWMEPSYDDTHWEQVTVEEAPETNLYVQDCPADRVIRRINPKFLGEREGLRIYDAGELITGYPVFASDAPAGEEIQVRYGELLDSQGKLDEEHTYGQHTNFITDGRSRKLHCRFTWMCFRYFAVKGAAQVEDVAVIHSDVAVNSSFSCQDEILNWIRDAYIRTQLDNMHCGIPSDCPHAERRGYTGDGQLTCAAAMLQLDARRFYRKWIYDIADCQDHVTGHVQYTSPFFTAGGGPGGWGCAIVVVPYEYYKHYGERDILEELYPQMLHWFDFMEAHSEDELVTSDLEGVWCLGDWCAPAMGFNELDAARVPEPFVNTYFYVKSMELVLEINEILNMHENDGSLRERIAKKKQAMTARYYDPATGDFAGNRQGSNAFALDLGMGDQRTFGNMVAYYQEIRKYDTGIFATDILTRLLFERGEAELAVRLLTSREDISFWQQMQNGATTISEYWTGHRSQCHPMFGAVSRYLYEYVLGIRQREHSAGFEQIVIEPVCMDFVPGAKGHITTVRGEISVEYGAECITVSLPRDTEAVLKLPGREYVLRPGKTNTPL